jgi:hypothetical protein
MKRVRNRTLLYQVTVYHVFTQQGLYNNKNVRCNFIIGLSIKHNRSRFKYIWGWSFKSMAVSNRGDY